MGVGSSQGPYESSRPRPGVYAVGADAELSLVHEYISEEYDLGDVPELLQLGRIDPGPANVGPVLVMDRRTLRALRVAVDASSFDLTEGFVEMCRDIQEYAASCPYPEIRLTSRYEEPES